MLVLKSKQAHAIPQDVHITISNLHQSHYSKTPALIKLGVTYSKLLTSYFTPLFSFYVISEGGGECMFWITRGLVLNEIFS